MPNWLNDLMINLELLGRSYTNALWEDKNYIVLTPPISKLQIVFSKRDRRFLFYHTRSYVDYFVLAQIFVSEDYNLYDVRGKDLIARYKKIISENKIPLIIDCGANIGLSTSLFARWFPRARIIAVEPDINNLTQAKLNCNLSSVYYMLAGISSENGFGNIIDPNLGEWGYRTELKDEGTLRMVSVQQILDENKNTEPLIIKIDIEGSESELFSKNTQWIEQFPLLIIELHDQMLPGTANSKAFLQTIASLGRDFIPKGENIFSYAVP